MGKNSAIPCIKPNIIAFKTVMTLPPKHAVIILTQYYVKCKGKEDRKKDNFFISKFRKKGTVVKMKITAVPMSKNDFYLRYCLS